MTAPTIDELCGTVARQERTIEKLTAKAARFEAEKRALWNMLRQYLSLSEVQRIRRGAK